MIVIYSTKFYREYKRIPTNIKKQAEKMETIFRLNPFNPILKTHKLTGNLKDFWSFSVDYKNRIIFEFISENTVCFHSIGSHDIYK